MKIGILSRGPRLYSTKRLRQAAVERGHQCRVLDTLAFSISLEESTPDLMYRGRAVSRYDAIIPRVGASITYFGTAVVRQFEQMGVTVLNTALAITNSRDKLRSLQILSSQDVGIPATSFVRRQEDVLPAIDQLGGAPVIIKLLEGTQGVGVILAETHKVAEAIVETLRTAKQNVLLQKFVAESKGRDVRAFVVGDRVVAAMRRKAQGGEFRSNVHRGGSTEVVELDEVYESTAVRAAHIMGLTVAGVDMLEGADGPQVMEVNSSPGLEGIEGATGIDVAGLIVEHLEEQVKFPELDVRQRLAVSRDYVVAEVQVTERSPFCGETIARSGLREQDIVVLTLSRNGREIANPKGSRQILAQDRLLCFGKRSTLENLVPPPKRRRRKRKRASG
ncbi:MAG: 30S ribosomal protein S6--L-glutamate ligase [Thermoanaerobaculia bacterium]|nr:30S ribosomal protein S6--L-glutamate ligase [Thermoanaerobaculia bacterium]